MRDRRAIFLSEFFRAAESMRVNLTKQQLNSYADIAVSERSPARVIPTDKISVVFDEFYRTNKNEFIKIPRDQDLSAVYRSMLEDYRLKTAWTRQLPTASDVPTEGIFKEFKEKVNQT